MEFLKKDFTFRKNQIWCLEGKKGKGYGKRYRYDFRKPLEAHFRKCGVVNPITGKLLGSHQMRHSFAANCVRAGKPTLQVASWMGNRERTLEQHYAHVLPDKGALKGVF
jgi:integrase